MQNRHNSPSHRTWRWLSLAGIILAFGVTAIGAGAGLGSAAASGHKGKATPDTMGGMPGMPGMKKPAKHVRVAPYSSFMTMTEGILKMQMLMPSSAPATWEDISKVYTMLNAARQAADKYRDVTVALADGFVTAPVLLVGTQGYHYVNLSLLPESGALFDVTKPPVLVYNKVNGQMKLSSVVYLMGQSSSPTQLARIFPPSMAGWHKHIDICFDVKRVYPIYSRAACLAKSHYWSPQTDWMVHAWLWENKTGLFNMDK